MLSDQGGKKEKNNEGHRTKQLKKWRNKSKPSIFHLKPESVGIPEGSERHTDTGGRVYYLFKEVVHLQRALQAGDRSTAKSHGCGIPRQVQAKARRHR